MNLTESLLGALVLSLVVASLARSRGWGIALPVLGAGILIGLLPFGPTAPEDAGEVFLFVLAPLIFGEALSSSFFDIRRVRRPVLALSIGLVIVSSVAVGAVASALVPSIPLSMALALGAVLSPTDAVAVAAVAKRASLPRRVVTILEGESLVNDGTGLTLLRVALAAAAAGALSGGEVVLTLLQSVLGGILVGVVVGVILLLVIRKSSDSLIANCAILVAPFPVYIGAEELGGSGILAVVTTALIATNAMNTDAGFRGRTASVAAWRQISFVLQAFAFFLVGMELPVTIEKLDDTERSQLPVLVIACLVTLLIARAVFVILMTWLSKATHRDPLAWREAFVLAWAGTRGPVSGLAAFSIPVVVGTQPVLGTHHLLLATTFVVIVVTLLLAPTLGLVARLVRIPPDDDVQREQQLRAALAARGIERLDEAVEHGVLTGDPYSDEAVQRVRDRLLATLHAYDDEEDHPDAVEVASQAWTLDSKVLRAQQQELLRLRDEEGIPDGLVRPLLRSLDVQQQALKARRPQ